MKSKIKFLTIIAFQACLSFTLLGQETRKAQVSFIYPLGTNGVATNIRNDFSFNMLVGVNGGVNNFEIGGIANINKGTVTGLQLGGIANVNTGRSDGLIMSGIANVVTADTRGVMFSGIGNYIEGNSTGLQLGGIANLNKGDFNRFAMGAC